MILLIWMDMQLFKKTWRVKPRTKGIVGALYFTQRAFHWPEHESNETSKVQN